VVILNSVISGGGNFANKTFANWRNSRRCVGESRLDFRHLSRNNINIEYMLELKLMLLEYIYMYQSLVETP
jgi:hypothetical protein